MRRDCEAVLEASAEGRRRSPAQHRGAGVAVAAGPDRHGPGTSGASALLHLQRSAGNAAVVRGMPLLQRGRFTAHAAERGQERGISNTRMREVMRTGARYDDPLHEGSIVYYEASTGWAVCTIDGQVTTTYNTPRPKPRWVRR